MSLKVLKYSATGAVLVTEEDGAPYADLTDCSDSFEQKVERAKEIAAAVNAVRRLSRQYQGKLYRCSGCEGRFTAEDLREGRCQLCIETRVR